MKRFLFCLVLFLSFGWFPPAGADKASGVYGDTVFEREGKTDGLAPAVFPHWVHRIRYRCSACHPKIFKAEKGLNPVTMEAIQKGESCGVCHNGSVSWNIRFETCSKCHRPDGAGP